MTLFSMLAQEFAKETAPENYTIDAFIDFCHTYLTKTNPIAGVSYILHGISLALTKGQILPLTPQAPQQAMNAGSILITKPPQLPGWGDMLPDTSVPVTGVK